MENRYQTLFTALESKNEAAFVPFVCLGDPTPELSLAIVDQLIESGADALELGVPFSDPSADGPTIQQAALRALNAGTTPTICFELIAKIRAKHPTIPIGLLLYVNLVVCNGIDNFYQRAAAAGVDSILIADVPLHESAPFKTAASAHGIDTIFIAPPNASAETIKGVAEHGQGYTYLVSRAGVTGAENAAEMPMTHLIDDLKQHQAPPALLGFGISNVKQVRAAIDAGAAGVISGSAVVNRINDNLDNPQAMLAALDTFISEMKSATRG